MGEVTAGFLRKHFADGALFLGAVLTILVILVPLHPSVLDFLSVVSLGGALLLLASSFSVPRAVVLSAFPSILLLGTVFRLSLNVASTRMILGHGKAGRLVDALGQTTSSGDLVVGLVVFLVLCVVQFLVVAKGAERVAEVGARFTLDAMPGKQMSIDADLRAGTIGESEAQKRRSELGVESQFFGAMDGAMKFVKGDAIAGFVIVALNFVAGVALGVLRHDLQFAEALEVYSLLTIGDGLVAQLPTLLVAVAAGAVTTRVTRPDDSDGLAKPVLTQLSRSPVGLGLVGAAVLFVGFLPGFPLGVFGVVGLLLCGAALWAGQGRQLVVAARQSTMKQADSMARKPSLAPDPMLPAVVPVCLELGADLSEAMGFADQQRPHLTEVVLPQMRPGVVC